MTQQYVAGEMSLLLARLGATATDEMCARAAAGLQREAELVALARLDSVATRALALADRMCWQAIASGDLVCFDRHASAGAALYEFCVCAGLMPDG
jgi:hypothetical protein